MSNVDLATEFTTMITAQRGFQANSRVIGAAEPEVWSEHLAFVRGGGREIGHLAAPPRRPATLEGHPTAAVRRQFLAIDKRVRVALAILLSG